jgi:hypothetical protein
MKKTVMKMPVNVAKQVDPAEAWVQNRAPESATVVPLAAPIEPMKRFTIDVSESLHKRIKMQCAARGQKMADVIREILEKEFPAESRAGRGA